MSPQLTIASSNLNVPPTSLLSRTAAFYADFLVEGGFDTQPDAGYEWHDLRFPAARRAGRALAEAGMISSLHESFNENTPLSAVRGSGSLGVAAVLPLLDRSYPGLAKLQVHQPLPLIVHPDGQQLDNQPAKRPRQTYDRSQFAEIWYQPTAEWAAAHAIHTDTNDTASVVAEIEEVRRSSGLDKTVIDLHHLTTKRSGFQFRRPTEVAVGLAALDSLGEIQFSVRPDFGGRRTDLYHAWTGQLAITQAGEILQGIAGVARKLLRIVSEIAASEIVRAGQSHVPTAHAAINQAIREIVSRTH